MSLAPSPPSLAFWNPPSWALMGLALAGILWLGLAPPMVAALVMFCLILAIRRVLSRKFPSSPPITILLPSGAKLNEEDLVPIQKSQVSSR